MPSPDLAEREFLVTGGATGTGYEIVAHLTTLSPRHIYIGTSHPDNFARATTMLGKKGFDISKISPFYTDVTNKDQLGSAVQEIKANGGNVTDEVYSHAAGMESFMQRMSEKHLDPIVDEYTYQTPIEELAPDKQAEVHERLAVMREDLAVWTQEALPHAIAVNYQGTFDTMEVLDDTFPSPDKRRVFLNSTWGHLSGQEGIQIPLLYRPVDLSKAMVRDRLAKEDGPNWELVASLVKRTKVGKMFYDFLLNLTSAEQRQAIDTSAIFIKDVVGAVSTILGTEPAPKVLFVHTKGGEVVLEDSLDVSSAMYREPYLF